VPVTKILKTGLEGNHWHLSALVASRSAFCLELCLWSYVCACSKITCLVCENFCVGCQQALLFKWLLLFPLTMVPKNIKKAINLQLWPLKLRSHFLCRFEQNWTWVVGLKWGNYKGFNAIKRGNLHKMSCVVSSQKILDSWACAKKCIQNSLTLQQWQRQR
jgi:hypothetical protein